VAACSLDQDDLALLSSLKSFAGRVPTPSQGQIDTLQDDVVDFDPLLESDFAQCLINRLRQVQAGVDDRWPLLLRTGRARSVATFRGSPHAAFCHGSGGPTIRKLAQHAHRIDGVPQDYSAVML
jgi:hypothetical protein